jgi:hypothetical protein
MRAMLLKHFTRKMLLRELLAIPACVCLIFASSAQVSVCAGVPLSSSFSSSSSSNGVEASARAMLKSCKKEMEGVVAEERLKVQLAKESADAEVTLNERMHEH